MRAREAWRYHCTVQWRVEKQRNVERCASRKASYAEKTRHPCLFPRRKITNAPTTPERASTRIDHKRFIPAVLIGVWRFSAMDILDVDAHRITPGFLRSELTKWVDALPLKVNKPLYYHGVPDTKLSLTGRPRGLGARSHPTFNLTLTAVRIASQSSRHFSVAGTTRRTSPPLILN